MSEPVIIEQIDLQGFRGFLKPQSILVRKSYQNNLAILAPNGNGKSSFVDALEYYFKTGKATLGRLGVKTTDKQAGCKYVSHVSAGENNTIVNIRFKWGSITLEDSRTGDPIPNAATRILPLIKVPFIIRDYELREFVQENQYDKLVEWFNFGSLNTIQKNLQALKTKIHNMKKDKRVENELLDQLKTLTGHEFQTGDESEVLKWLEGGLVEVGVPIRFKKLTDDDPAFQELVRRSEMEQGSVTASHLHNLLDVIKNLFTAPTPTQAEPTGLIVAFEKAVLDFERAITNMNEVKSTISDYAFQKVWAKAQELLLGKPHIDHCPVCETPFDLSNLGSREIVLNNLRINLRQLDEYTNAENEKNAKEEVLNNVVTHLKTKLDEFFRWAGSEYQYGPVTDYSKAIQSWEVGDDAPSSINAVNTLTKIHSDVAHDIQTQSNESVYSSALNVVKDLFKIVASQNRIKHTKYNLTAISDSLDRQTGIIDRTIADHINNLVDKLQDDAQAINQEIQGPYAPKHPIEIKLADKDKQNQRAAHIFTNFMNRGEGVPPNGVLSESQNRTLALAIRLAAINMFNTEFKVIVLDDVTMSYDAERRQNIAALLHERFSRFQIIAVTHDSFFYEELRRRCPPRKWRFMEFKQFADDYGPIITDKKTLVDVINEKIVNNEPINGNDMRKACEEWFDHICAGFETLLPHRLGKPHDLHDLIESLGKFLHDNSLKSPSVSGYSGNYLEALKSAKILNLDSHHNPHSNITSNELKTEWKGFMEFINHFKCNHCDSDRLVKVEGKRPYCSDCGEEFSFT